MMKQEETCANSSSFSTQSGDHPSPGVSRTCSFNSLVAEEECQESSQTLLFLDFDDTLFPTTELFHRRGLPLDGVVDADLDLELGPWRDSFRRLLSTCCSLADRCVIVTSSKRPWVETCVERFAPELRPAFAGAGGPRVVYAGEALLAERAAGGCLAGLVAWWQSLPDDHSALSSTDAHDKEHTVAKHAAMKREAQIFYRGQPFRNVLSLGDMHYERDAVKQLSAMRTKVVTVTSAPSIHELTLSLQFTELMLPAYVRGNDCIDVDLSAVPDLIRAADEATTLPQFDAYLFPESGGCRSALAESIASVVASLPKDQC